MIKNNVGKNQGLTLVLDGHSDHVSPGTVQEDSQGFLALVSSRYEFPATEKVIYSVQMEKKTYAEIFSGVSATPRSRKSSCSGSCKYQV